MSAFRWLRAAVLVAWLPLSAHANTTPEAAGIVAAYVRASGGEAAVFGVRSTATWATLKAFGLDGSMTVWTRTPDARAERTRIGPLEVREGFDGTTAWRVEPSGSLVMLDGRDLEEAKASAWFENERWLTPDQGGGRIEVVTEAGADTLAVLEITPPAGRARRYAFGRATGLLVRVTARTDQQTAVTEFTDYRAGPATPEVPARLVPFAISLRVEDLPANDVTVRIDSMAINVDIDDARFAPPATGGDQVRYLKTPGRASVSFEYVSRHVWLRASVNGQPPADFLYDTGASMTVLDSTYAARLGIETQGRLHGVGAGAAGGATLASLQSLRVEGPDGDGVELGGQRIAVLSLNPVLAPFFWRDCAGVIGYDFITRFVNRIDFDARTIELLDPDSFTPSDSATAIPLRLAGTIPVVTLTLEDTLTGEFRVDVGSGSTVDLHAPYVRAHGLDQGGGARIPVTGGGFGGTFEAQIMRMKSLVIGPFAIADPVIGLSGATIGALASEDYAGNLGNQLLERFRCTFDYGRRVLHLEPGAKFSGRDRFTRCGILMAQRGDQIQVAQVIPGSPGSRAGLRAGDVVTAVNGRPPLELGRAMVDALLEEQPVGTKVRLEIDREGRRKKVTLKLAEVL